MSIFHKSFTVALLLFGLAGTTLADDLPPRTFLHPDRIRYDSQCLTIDGRDVFLYSGAFHYFRCPKELWADRFKKIKDAGFNCVETYVAWNVCEPEMPANVNDFSHVHLNDLDDYLTLAEKYGLYVIVRPGPYICAEWDSGGYPQWLMTKQPVADRGTALWLRSDGPVYLSWCKHWYDAVCPVIAKHQITRKSPGQPGVILVQLENEYDYAKFSDDVKLNQVRLLGRTARADGIDVPLITCWTHQVRGQADPLLRQVFDCGNFYPHWNVDGIQKDIDKLRREQPDAPLATTELQGGWFSKVGGKLSEQQDGITGAQINNLTLFAIQNGETILNYYMLYGGINLGDRAARNLTTSYDYNAPIREWGGVGDRYQRVWALGHLLQEHGTDLARSKFIECNVTVPQGDVTVVLRQASNGGRYLFVRTSQHDEPRQGTAHVTPQAGGESQELVFDYQLEPFGSKILYLPPGVNDPAHGEWFPKIPAALERPTDLPKAVNLTAAFSRDDNGPATWSDLAPGEDLAQAGIYDSGFICYRATVSCATATNLQIQIPKGDAVLAEINGQMTQPTVARERSSIFPVPAGTNEVRLWYENHGHDHGGEEIAQAYGVLSVCLVPATNGVTQALDHWRMLVVKRPDDKAETGTGFDDSSWSTVEAASVDANQLKSKQSAVFRRGVELTAQDIDGGRESLTFGRIDDRGWVYVNGQQVGHTTDWSRAYTFEITKFLHPGHNVIAVVVQNMEGDGGLGQVLLSQEVGRSKAQAVALGHPQGNEQQWWQPELAIGDWRPVNIGGGAESKSDSPLTWYRMNFALPAQDPKVWVPWRVHLEADGNGFLYLNGQAIGRYWAAGPQHDFYLPECWLKFGDGQTNNLTLNLRPVKGAAGIQNAVVEPYSEFAEKR